MLLEKRRHERKEAMVRFRCYLQGGSRYPALSLDMCEGGVFLTSLEMPALDSVIVIEPIDKNHDPVPVLLVGRVVRQEQGTRTGVAVMWLKATTRKHPALLQQFLRDFFKIDSEPDIPDLSLERLEAGHLKTVFDFKTGRFKFKDSAGVKVSPDWSLLMDPNLPLPRSVTGEAMFQYSSTMDTDISPFLGFQDKKQENPEEE